MANEQISLHGDSFQLNAIYYKFADVAHLSWFASHTNVKTAFIPTGSYDNANLIIVLRNSESLSVNAGVFVLSNVA